jgi:hypothetical protein
MRCPECGSMYTSQVGQARVKKDENGKIIETEITYHCFHCNNTWTKKNK